jgi:hypothetical protein
MMGVMLAVTRIAPQTEISNPTFGRGSAAAIGGSPLEFNPAAGLVPARVDRERSGADVLALGPADGTAGP